ncbi:dihydrofolate reductase [Candidatus Saccharibacteria bacterium]|nr:MAG: dihydrofolate reductase [Candidatus Saccharibacteria bacterium]
MDKSIIVAYDKNRAIGQNNDLPWGRSLPADLANFKRLTAKGSMIMGRRTFESIGSRPLPDRENIVVSSRPTGVKGILSALDVDSATQLARYPIFFLGGAKIFEEALKIADVIYATEVDHVFPEADVFFPEIGEDWVEVKREQHPKDERNAYNFDFVEYRRKG